MILPPRPFQLDFEAIGGIYFRFFASAAAAIAIWATLALKQPIEGTALIAAASLLPALASAHWFRRLSILRAVARDGEEVHADVAEALGSKLPGELASAGKWDYRLRVEDREIRHRANIHSERPLFVDAREQHALVLRWQRHFVVVQNDLRPFRFSPAEERAIRTSIEQLRGIRA